jgi:hypothetical protein
MEDEDLIDFNKIRPADLLSLKLPAFWVDKPNELVCSVAKPIQATRHSQGTNQI